MKVMIKIFHDQYIVTSLLSVRVWLDVDADVKASEIDIRISERSFELRIRDSCVLQKELRYLVNLPEDGVDWEVETSPDGAGTKRTIRLTLQKHVYVEGSVVWWSSVFVGDPEIDVSTIKGRQATSLSAAWQEANTLFRQKVADREKVDIDC